jgi:hypothetical protein
VCYYIFTRISDNKRFCFGYRIYWTLTSIYTAVANTHTLQFTTALLNSLTMPCSHQSLPVDGSQQSPLLPSSCSYRLETFPKISHCSNYTLNWLQLPVLLIISWYEYHRKHYSSVAVCGPLPSNGFYIYLFRGRCLATGSYAKYDSSTILWNRNAEMWIK